jgi:hypothetical protein
LHDVKRGLAQLCFAIGALFTLAAAALWVRAIFAHDAIDLKTGYRSDRLVVVRVDASLSSCAGDVTVRWTERYGLQGEPFDPAWLVTTMRRRTHEPQTVRLGFGYEAFQSSDVAQWIGRVPLWFVFVVGIALAAPSFAALRAPGRHNVAGLCPSCGYDLRGAAHERCPECGQAVGQQQSATSASV